jgi:hypothetical protein
MHVICYNIITILFVAPKNNLQIEKNSGKKTTNTNSDIKKYNFNHCLGEHFDIHAITLHYDYYYFYYLGVGLFECLKNAILHSFLGIF